MTSLFVITVVRSILDALDEVLRPPVEVSPGAAVQVVITLGAANDSQGSLLEAQIRFSLTEVFPSISMLGR
jgi:hypothetical protein